MPVGHDQLWKELIQTFPADFVTLTMPDVASRIDLASVVFRAEELFLDSPRGRSVRLDLVAPIRGRSGSSEWGVLHTEVQLRYRASLGARWWRYGRVLGMRRGAPVHTLVLYLRGGPPGLKRTVYRERSFGRRVSTFHYDSFGVSRAPAADYLARPEPLAWALAALMQPRRSGRQRAELRLACLRRIAAAEALTAEQRFRLANIVRTYIRSDEKAADEYETLLVQPENREMREMITTWAEAVEAEGYAKGLQEGLQEGLRESLETMRSLVMRLLSQRFGRPSSELAARIDAIRSQQELARLAERVNEVDSLTDLGLSEV